MSGNFGTYSFQYDNERLVTISGGSGDFGFGYTGDVVGSMTAVNYRNGNNYEYHRSPLANSNGLIKSELIKTEFSTRTINYLYDADKFLTQAQDLKLTYNPPNGSLISTTLKNINEVYAYNEFGEVKSFNAFYIVNNVKKLLYSYALTRDNIGRITKKTENFGVPTEFFTSNYFYDFAGRLVKVTSNTRPVSTYAYSKNSNRLSGTREGVPYNAVYDNQDRLIKFNDTLYSYNANGDLLLKSELVGKAYINTDYLYDSLGNLKQAGKVTYSINPLQKRDTKLIDNNPVKSYAYSPEGRLMAEIDVSSLKLNKTFIYASKSHVPDYFIDQKNIPYKIITDQLGSVRLVVNASTGTVIQRMNHDEFGKITSDSKPGFTPFGFAGGLYDPETKLVRFGARDYDPEIGRWTSKDPIRFSGGDANLYGYVMSDPVNWIDPKGNSAVLALLLPIAIGEIAFDATTFAMEYWGSGNSFSQSLSTVWERSPSRDIFSTGSGALLGNVAGPLQFFANPDTFNAISKLRGRVDYLDKQIGDSDCAN